MIGGPCLGDLCCEAQLQCAQEEEQSEEQAWHHSERQQPSSSAVGKAQRHVCRSSALARVSEAPGRFCRWLYDRVPEKTRNLLMVWGLAVVMHVHTCWGSFVWDDRAAVITNANVNGRQPAWRILIDDFWGAPLTNANSHKSYRPLTTLTYRLNYAVHSFDPLGYHLVNVLLHATMCGLVLVFARTLLPDERTCLLASLLFVVHPVHVESVTPMVGRADLLCGCFYLPAVLLYRRSSADTGRPFARRMLSLLLSYVCALSSFAAKEVGLTVFGLFMVHDLYPSATEIMLHAGRGRLLAFISASLSRLKRPAVVARIFITFSVVAGLMALRVKLHGERTVMRWSILENEITYMDSRLSRGLATAHVHFIYLWKLFAPFRQTYDYGYACLRHVTSLADPRNLLSLAAYGLVAAVTAFALTQGSPELVWPMALLLVPFTPASHVLVYVGAVVAERLLYMPSIGFCLLVPTLAHLWVHDRLLLPPLDTLPPVAAATRMLARLQRGWQGAVKWMRRTFGRSQGRQAAARDEGGGGDRREGDGPTAAEADGDQEGEDEQMRISSTKEQEAGSSRRVLLPVLDGAGKEREGRRRRRGGADEGVKEPSEEDKEAEKRRRRRRREEVVSRGAAFWLGLLGLRTVWYSWMWMREETVFHNAYRTCPRSAKVCNNYGIGFLNVKHGHKAIRIFTEALNEFPEYANAHYNKALAHFLLGEHEAARMHFVKSLSQDTGNDMAYAYLGASETILAERATGDPASTAAERQRLLRAAAFHLDTAIAKNVETAQTFHYRGSVALAMEKHQLAVYYFERALAVTGRHRAFSTDDPRMAPVKPFTDEIREAYAYNQIGLAYKGMGMVKEAEQAFLRGLEHEPDMYELVANMGVLLLDANQLDMAKLWLERALAMNPASPDLLNNMGVVEERRGSFHLARKYYRQAADVAPHVGTVQGNLARVEKALQGLH